MSPILTPDNRTKTLVAHARKGHSIGQLACPVMQWRAAAEMQPLALARPKLGLTLPGRRHHMALRLALEKLIVTTNILRLQNKSLFCFPSEQAYFKCHLLCLHC